MTWLKGIMEAGKPYKDDPYPIFTATLKALGLQPEREYRFCDRRWAFDYALVKHKLAIEVEGGIWIGGGHARPANVERDIDKYNEAMFLGWRVLRVRPRDMKPKGQAVELVLRAVGSG